MEAKRRGYMFHVQLLRNNIPHFLLENNPKQIRTLIGLKTSLERFSIFQTGSKAGDKDR